MTQLYFYVNFYWQTVELEDKTYFTHKFVRREGSAIVDPIFRFGANLFGVKTLVDIFIGID